MMGENHQAGRKLEESESICALQSKHSVRGENNKEEAQINELRVVCLGPQL